MIETWKDIPGYEGYYQASTEGRIKSLERIVARRGGRGNLVVRERILKARFRSGRLSVLLSRNGLCKDWCVHTLVLLAFKGPRPEGMECRHFPDRSPLNNKPGNLRWGTPKENSADKIVHGTSCRGVRNGRARLSTEKVLLIREKLRQGITRSAIAVELGIRYETVRVIDKGLLWKHTR